MEVKFNDVSYTYNRNTPLQTEALTNISVDLAKNKIHGIIGPSGSGKTTLIELINALLFPNKGTIMVGNYNLKKYMKMKEINKLRFEVGLVFQFPEEQFFNSTVEKEIAFAMKYFKYKTNVITKRITESLKLVGLDETYLKRNPFYLSNGEKRRVAIASILVFNPRIIILDEPTVGLDNNGKQMLIKNIKLLRDRYGKTIIICSHDVDTLHQLVDNLVVLHKGSIICTGSKEEVFLQQELLNNYNIKLPRIVEFINKVNVKKERKLGNHTDINELIKDIYRNV